MKEINEKDMEKASGGSAWNEPYMPRHRTDDCCDEFEMDTDRILPQGWENTPQYRKCRYCVHAQEGYSKTTVCCTVGK